MLHQLTFGGQAVAGCSASVTIERLTDSTITSDSFWRLRLGLEHFAIFHIYADK
jgi:hypothetical protein